MITNISLTIVYCLDQTEARDFYVNVLGFQARADVPMGGGSRWVTVGHPSQPELDVALITPGPPLDEDTGDLIRRQLNKGQMGAVGLRVDDCRKTSEELRAKGVTFVQEPSVLPYGTQAVIRDNSGNWLVLVEPRELIPRDIA